MQAICTAKLANGKPRRFQLLGGNHIDDEDRPDGLLTYSFDDRLVEVLKNSFTFGKLQLAVMRASLRVRIQAGKPEVQDLGGAFP